MSELVKNYSYTERKKYSNTFHEVSILLISLVIIVFSLLVLTDSPIIKIKSAKMRGDQSTNTSGRVDTKNVALFSQK